jgi:hypothetical protein
MHSGQFLNVHTARMHLHDILLLRISFSSEYHMLIGQMLGWPLSKLFMTSEASLILGILEDSIALTTNFWLHGALTTICFT